MAQTDRQTKRERTKEENKSPENKAVRKGKRVSGKGRKEKKQGRIPYLPTYKTTLN